jgi:hypothetical protein
MIFHLIKISFLQMRFSAQCRITRQMKKISKNLQKKELLQFIYGIQLGMILSHFFGKEDFRLAGNLFGVPLKKIHFKI